MNENAASPVEVRQQIWESLVSMLRVYAHAASLNGQSYGVASNARTAWVTCMDSVLEVGYSAQDGAASWQLSQPNQRLLSGKFSIEADGSLSFPEGPKELDQAAIEWVEKLVSTMQINLSSRPERTRISDRAAPQTATNAAFSQGKPQEAGQSQQSQQEIRGSVVEGSAVSLNQPQSSTSSKS